MTSPTPFPPSPMSRDSEMETRLAAIEARANAAAEGPWDVGAERDGVYGGRRTVVRDSSLLRIVSVGQTRLHDNLGAEANVEFIAHAREDVPWLIGRVRELESRLAGADSAAYYRAAMQSAAALSSEEQPDA